MAIEVLREPFEVSLVGMADFVLGDFSAKELTIAEEMVDRAADAVHVILTQGLDTAMNQFNSS